MFHKKNAARFRQTGAGRCAPDALLRRGHPAPRADIVVWRGPIAFKLPPYRAKPAPLWRGKRGMCSCGRLLGQIRDFRHFGGEKTVAVVPGSPYRLTSTRTPFSEDSRAPKMARIAVSTSSPLTGGCTPRSSASTKASITPLLVWLSLVWMRSMSSV